MFSILSAVVDNFLDTNFGLLKTKNYLELHFFFFSNLSACDEIPPDGCRAS